MKFPFLFKTKRESRNCAQLFLDLGKLVFVSLVLNWKSGLSFKNRFFSILIGVIVSVTLLKAGSKQLAAK